MLPSLAVAGGAPLLSVPASPSNEPTLAELLDALDRLAGTEFHEVDMRLGRVRLRVSRGAPAVATAAPAIASAAPSAPHAMVSGAPEKPADDADDVVDVTAPMVGTFYRRPRPEAEPFVSLGDPVAKGQPLCIIEAMKLMNNIEADVAGEIVDILPEDGDAVQFGDVLIRIRPR